ncbi:MAG TPA: radical SAM protein, partial [bacterium]|nr:radical SAM protein [bacterium]
MLNNPLTLRQAPARLRDVTRWLAACCLGRRAMIYVQYLVTLRCNLRCTYCDYSRQQTDEMPIADALRRVDEMIALGLRKLSLVGGEPLLYAGLPQLLRHCRTRNVTCNIITNGILFVERARELHDADLVIFSLDGPEAVHDAETAPGTHRAVISGIDYCCRHNLPMAINTVLHRGNIAHVDYLLRLSEEYRMPVLFQPAENFPSTVSPSLRRMMLSREQLHEIYTYLIRRQDEGCRIGYSRDHLAAIAAGSALPQCRWAGRLMFTMLPDGRLAPCNPMIFSPDHIWPNTAAGCAAALAQLPPFT